ncbi:MAG: MFS transporter [Gemmatimonadetes bacterium]|jgi:multidrug resistance protein|nr:MFS transporter [Gemmatimonadota bacterium]MBP6670363.1 MFS transporter [Gemmatimonadales bacterium]MBK6782211.1 MFS transporter [Gemmatimonadota bacterium]MBK7351936.1 MFS transporter [Gemmatimonadota bacterium]MBK7717426.1 MFS transporter [Gemmatimonadota bacterium]
MPSPSLLIFLTVFIDLIGFGIVLPLLPSYAAAFQVGDTGVGLLVASFSLMQFLLAPWWGRLSDRVGRRPVLLVGLAGSAISYLVFGLAGSFWLLLVSRLVAGAMGATVNVAQAYLADVTPADRRAGAMGRLGAAFGLGFVVGPAIGGLSSHWGSAAPGLVASALTGLNLVLAWRWLPESRRAAATGVATAPVHWSRFLGAFSATACSTVAFTVLYVIFPLQVERSLGLDRHDSAYLFVLIGVVSAAVQGGLIGRLVRRHGEPLLIAVGGVVLALGLALLPRALTPGAGLPLLCGALVLVAAGSATIGPSAAAFVSRVAPAEEQGRALGLLQSVSAVARIIGPIAAGGIASAISPRAAFYAASAAAGCAGLSAFLARAGMGRPSVAG